MNIQSELVRKWALSVADAVKVLPSDIKDTVSDGYHTFAELYEFRKLYNALIFNEWGKEKTYTKQKDGNVKLIHCKFSVHKSWKHFDGEYCFGEEKKWFIVCAKLPDGIITNHYKAEDWDLFQIPEVEKSLFEFDNHTAVDVITRITNLIKLNHEK